MALVKTTLRIEENLKKAAEKKALEEDKTFQEIYNEALEGYLLKPNKARISKTVEWVNKYIEENRPALEELAKK